MSKDPIVGFGTAEHVAGFLLQEAFHYANQAAIYEAASDLFRSRIEAIEPDPTWQSLPMPTTLAEWLSTQDEVIESSLDPETTRRLSDAWHSSLNDAPESGLRFEKKRRLQSLNDIVGHVVNLTLCLEAVLNRQLFFLREVGELSRDHHKMMDRSELMPKLLFCFKEAITGKRLHVSRIRQLVTLRNHAVHYRIESADALSPSFENLIEIWRELGDVFSHTTGEPTAAQIRAYSDDYVAAWIAR